MPPKNAVIHATAIADPRECRITAWDMGFAATVMPSAGVAFRQAVQSYNTLRPGYRDSAFVNNLILFCLE
jgi:hypothetical protein